jgi:hypothetical protein
MLILKIIFLKNKYYLKNSIIIVYSKWGLKFEKKVLIKWDL